MSLTPAQQLIETINRANHILITTRAIPAETYSLTFLDGLGAGLALAHFLERLNKRLDLIISGFQPKPYFSFLPKINEIKSEPQAFQKLIIQLEVAQNQLHELSYDLKDNKLQIYITPKYGFIKPEEIKASQEKLKYDLIITCDTPDLESIGELFKKYSSLFLNTPIINIDHSEENEHFGAINIVDLTASATSEVVYNSLENWDRSLISQPIATSLLTGLIAKTQSFKRIKSPKTFQTASRLIALGGEREKIMQSLFHNRSLATFRLWGIVLAHLKHDSTLKFTWSTLTQRDFLDTEGNEADLPALIQELILSSKDTDHSLLLYEKTNLPIEAETVFGLLFSTKIRNVSSLVFSPLISEKDILNDGPGFIRFCLRQTKLAEAEKETVDLIKKRLYNYLRT